MSANGLSSGAAASRVTTDTSAAPPPPSKKPRRTFYRRPLPDLCTALSSPEGRSIFSSAHNSGGLKSFFPLMEQFSTQTEPAYCGPTTLVVVLNALSVDPRRTWKGPWRWYQESFLNCCVDLDTIKKTGITFQTFACLARCQGLTVDARLGSESSIEEFRAAVKEACVDHDKNNVADESSAKFLVVSYNRKTVGQTGSGHFSPIAAYDQASDSVLVLDTARFKYGAHWVPLELMFDALLPVDPDAGKSRGYALLSYEFSDHDHPNLPRSFLFRSKKVQDPVRRLFKSFLSEHDKHHAESISFQHVLDFWTKNGTDMDYIWSILDPQLAPMDEQEEAVVDNVRALLKELIDKAGPPNDKRLSKSKSVCKDSCGGNSCGEASSRTIPMTSIEAMFVVHLAALPPDERKDLVYQGRSKVKEKSGSASESNITHEQLLCEIELVQYAIEASDEDG